MSNVSDIYCPTCTSVLVEVTDRCTECQGPVPAKGWPKIRESPYSWLGKLLDGRYMLNKFLGQGATGVVYRAQALKIRRQFAAKIVDISRYGRDEHAAELLRRFQSEVLAMGQIRNPHVVGVYEVLQVSETIFVLIMEYVNGRTLEQVLEHVGRVKRELAVDIVRQVANGLYEAHTLGFIHRDLKPENIMLEKLPASGFFAKVLDFGIVHEVDGAGSTQGFRGTPLYASPEQCLGNPVDRRSDIYSLGCVFFHLLAGRPPFVVNNSMKAMQAHVTQTPPRVRDVAPNTRVCKRVEDLIARMLAKDPDKRPSNMSEVIQEIDRLTFESQLEEQTNPAPPSEVIAPTTESLAEATAALSSLVREVVLFPLPLGRAASTVTCSTLHRQGEFAVLADKTNIVHFWKRGGKDLSAFQGARSQVSALHIDMKTQALYAGERDGRVISWSLSSSEGTAESVCELSDEISALGTQSRGDGVLIGTREGRLISYDLKTKSKRVLVRGQDGISALAVSPMENKVFVGFESGRLEVIDIFGGQVRALEAMPSRPISMVCSDDGYVAAVLDQEGNLRVLSLIHGTAFFEANEGPDLQAIAFDSTSQLLGMSLAEDRVVDSVNLLQTVKVRTSRRAL